MIRSKRGSRDIVADILKLCIVPQNKTSIVYRCNLNFTTVNQYLSWCHIHGWLVNPDNLYQTTELGETYLKIVERVFLLEEEIIIGNDMI